VRYLLDSRLICIVVRVYWINMAHLIETIYGVSVGKAISLLETTHSSIVSCVINDQSKLSTETKSWGVIMKRLEIDLLVGEGLVGKSSEKYVEVINILATVERTIAALKWFDSKFVYTSVQECHPSTSDNDEGNDIVLVDSKGNIIVRCEVCDVVSSTAGQNGKEKKDINNLGCAEGIPEDNVHRFIATSSEFASALVSEKRKWKNLPYRYKWNESGLDDNTILLEVVAD